MPLILPGNVASAVSGAFEVANSCRFNNDDGPYMHKTPSAGNLDLWTYSMWFKRCSTGVDTPLFGASPAASNDFMNLTIRSSDDMDWSQYNYGTSAYEGRLLTTRKFRDPAAWYHLVAVWDSANGTAGNRMRIYINGVEETVFTTDTNPSSGQDSLINSAIPQVVGGQVSGPVGFDGYLAEVYFIDGTVYGPTDFGEFDEDSPTIWKPIDASGLTFGTNGFYLDFEASDNLGNDANGGTDFTEVSLDATDQATDTPTNSFCTWNPLVTYYSDTVFTQGNLTQTSATGEGGIAFEVGTFGLTAGKWYWEAKMTTFTTSGGHIRIGITDAIPISDPNYFAYNANSAYSSGQFAFYSANGNIYHGADGDGGNDAYGNAWNQANGGQGVIISVAMDLDNNKL